MKTEHIFDLLYAGYGINIKELNIKELRDYYIISMCRYAQFYAFISVIELPRIPAYRPNLFSEIPYILKSLSKKRAYGFLHTLPYHLTHLFISRP